MRYVALRAVYDGNDNFLRWQEVGPCDSCEDARQRYAPVILGYAVVLERRKG